MFLGAVLLGKVCSECDGGAGKSHLGLEPLYLLDEIYQFAPGGRMVVTGGDGNERSGNSLCG